jgi:hypothetical protein
MLCKAKTLRGFSLDSLDGKIGKVSEFYFDDRYWTIRYLVADTGNWLPGRQVLLSPYALGPMKKDEKNIAVHLTQKQIENSPSLDSDKPVSRQFEESYYGYYDWPVYWDGSSVWGMYPYITRDSKEWKKAAKKGKAWDPDLRSTQAVSGYHVQALDGEIGHVDDFIIDDETWTIRYLVIDTTNWWLGKKVLVSPQWVGSVSWSESKVFVNLPREAIKRAPEYTDWSILTREYEIDMHRFYSRQGYWENEPATLSK